VRIIATGMAVAALFGAAAAPAAGSPEHPTPEETNFVNAVRGKFPGDDAALIRAGEQVCTMLAYTGQPHSTELAAAYRASPDQVATLVNAAHDIICPYLPG
jgi:Protein of unknown function (DUF732)